MSKTTLVTVTYGKRWHLLRQAIGAAHREGVDCCIVVDNGAHENIAENIEIDFGDWASVIPMNRNTGSASAYKRGIIEAIDRQTDTILLLDDDNILSEGAMEKLSKAYEEMACKQDPSNFAIIGLRKEHVGVAMEQIRTGQRRRNVGSCLGFHLLDLAKKISWRLRKTEDNVSRDDGSMIQLQVAPYGGLLFHKSLVKRIGLPNTSYVLYVDDTDFTYRITRAGGSINLAPEAIIYDAEGSWDANSPKGLHFLTWLCSSSDFRAFYTLRNSIYFEIHVKKDFSLFYVINALIFACILTISAFCFWKWKRYGILLRAARHGALGKLGVDATFPLPV